MKYPFTLLRAFTLAVVLAAVFLAFISAIAEITNQSTPLGANSQQSQEDAWEAQQRREMAKQANTKRQQDLKQDTARLLELATELKQYVDKTNENTLSVNVIKKAEEIEKLAHSVKEKAK